MVNKDEYISLTSSFFGRSVLPKKDILSFYNREL